MLRGLKEYTKNITAIVAVTDDGGGSGVTASGSGHAAPDIRNCLLALANTEPVMGEIVGGIVYGGNPEGTELWQSLLAALNGISPSFDVAVRRMSEVLAITGRVLPVTNEMWCWKPSLKIVLRWWGESKFFSAKNSRTAVSAACGCSPGILRRCRRVWRPSVPRI